MKRGQRWGEGAMIAAVLLTLFALSCFLWWSRQPRAQIAAPVHTVSLEELRRAGTINVNTASASELEELPGIGPVLAEAIVAYREEHGPFASAEELLGVYGIGEGKLAAMRGLLRLD